MCTRTLFTSADGRVVTGRNMDWAEEMHTHLWAFAAGIERRGEGDPDAFGWTSVRSSVVASVYDLGTVDGINDAGLVANLLYLTEADFGAVGDKPRLSVAAWAQYVIDSFATVAEAVETLRETPFTLTSPTLPNGSASGVHLALSDATGDSAIFEFIDGELVIHHGPEYRVMTNSPIYDQQLAINSYWKTIGGDTMLPGTSRAADRFVRASYYLDRLPLETDDRQAAAGVFGVQRNAATPRGTATPGRPEVSETLWTTVLDSTDLRYYFQDTSSPDIFWVDVAALDFTDGVPSRRLDLTGHPVLAGEVSAKFEPHEPFPFLGLGGLAPSFV